MNRFVETDPGFELLLQSGMEVKVVVPKRLLNHEQIELVELLQMLHVVECVHGVRIAAQQDFWPASSNAFKDLEIPSRLAL